MQKELPELTTLLQEAVTELQTVNDLIRWSVSRFNESDIYLGHGTDNPWDEAAQLITYALSLPPTMNEHLLQARTTLSERKNALGYIEQRILTKKPAAYLTQVSYFCGLPFYVNEDVLVPRSPIGELITNKFEGLITEEPQRIMDLCTGSGCIAIATSFAFPDATIDALDISPEALAVADENIHRLQVEERVFPIMSDVFSSVDGLKYDLIVSNPPYVDLEDLGDMPAEFHHEPEIGLGSGNDGLDITRIILKQAAAHLEDNGLLIVEVGNSMIHLQAEFPEVPFNWLDFENGGIGVFAITKQQLIDYKDLF